MIDKRGYFYFALNIYEAPKIREHDIAEMPPEDYSPAEYSKEVFRMFGTAELEQVTLRCHVSIMKYMIDNFGEDVDTERIDDETFIARIKVYPSPTFYRWVFGFGEKMHILASKICIENYKKKLTNALAVYSVNAVLN